jgi:hypothetical protein
MVMLEPGRTPMLWCGTVCCCTRPTAIIHSRAVRPMRSSSWQIPLLANMYCSGPLRATITSLPENGRRRRVLCSRWAHSCLLCSRPELMNSYCKLLSIAGNTMVSNYARMASRCPNATRVGWTQMCHRLAVLGLRAGVQQLLRLGSGNVPR